MTAQPSALVGGADTSAPVGGADTSALVADLIRWLETGSLRPGLFAEDLFLDISFPQWRLQSDTAAGALAIRNEGHPCQGEVRVERVEQTGHGFTLEFEERWVQGGQHWYCREMARADVVGDTIVELSVYCTGDWDEAKQREHAAAVRLIRP